MKSFGMNQKSEHFKVLLISYFCPFVYTCSFDPSHCSEKNLKGKGFCPFGMGRRKCPGYMFSYVEVGVFLTLLLPKFSLDPVGGAKEVGQVHGLVTTPKEKLHYVISPIN